MSHKVVVGGFASSERQVKRAADILAMHYDEDIEGISFRRAMNDSGQVDYLTRRATVLTHSAGMVALRHTAPDEIIAIAPPLPVPILRLLARVGYSGLDLMTDKLSMSDDQPMLDECARELAEEFSLHPYGNLKHLGRISKFNAFTTGADAFNAGIVTSLAFMEKDRLFQPSAHELEQARSLGVRALTLPGGHEAFLCNTQKTIQAYDRHAQRA